MNKTSKGKKYNRIKAELAEAGKQNADLANFMGVHASTVSDWCTNTNQPSIQDLYRISEFLRINVRELLIETSWENEMLTQAAEPATVHKLKSTRGKSKHKSKNSNKS